MVALEAERVSEEARVGRPGGSLTSVAIPGCSPQVGAARIAAAPGGDRRRGAADDRPHHGRADRDDARPPGGLHPGPGPRVPQGDPLPGGGDVKKGQLLFVIDEEPFKAKLAEARAQLEQAEASLKKAQDSKAREVAAAQLALGQAMLALAEVEERREQSLLTSATPRRSRTSSASRRSARRTRPRSRPTRPAWSRPRPTTRRASSPPRPRSTAAKAGVRDAEINLGYCRMSRRSTGGSAWPRSRSATSSARRPAAAARLHRAGDDPAARPDGRRHPARSRDLDRATRLIAEGLPVEVFRPGLEGEEARRFPGKATVIDNTVDATTSTFLVKAEVPNPGGRSSPAST